MMHLCIILYKYWTPLNPTKAERCMKVLLYLDLPPSLVLKMSRPKLIVQCRWDCQVATNGTNHSLSCSATEILKWSNHCLHLLFGLDLILSLLTVLHVCLSVNEKSSSALGLDSPAILTNIKISLFTFIGALPHSHPLNKHHLQRQFQSSRKLRRNCADKVIETKRCTPAVLRENFPDPVWLSC